jgi:hypothetical protein
MSRVLTMLCVIALAASARAQSFEVSGIQDNYKAFIGETIKAPVRIRNTTDKPIFLTVKKISAQIGGTQRNYYCLDNNCLDQRTEEYTLRLEPDQVVNSLHIAVEAGLAQGHGSIRYHVTNKANSAEVVEFEMNFQIEERAEKEHIYSSRHMTLYDLYPNPVSVDAFVDYKMYDDQIKAKIVIHNILGNPIDEYLLPFVEEQVKIRAETLSAGIYFYTLYIDGEGVITRKLIVKK